MQGETDLVMASDGVEEKDCPVCEQEYRRVFPQLAVSYYAGSKDLQVRLNTDIEIGLSLETYIVNESLAIESKVLSEEKERLKAYQSIHIFIASDGEKDAASDVLIKLSKLVKSVSQFITSNRKPSRLFLVCEAGGWGSFSVVQ